MKLLDTLIVIATLLAAGSAIAQDADITATMPIDDEVIHEAPAAIKPIEATAKGKASAVVPHSLGLVDAFQEGVNIINLGPVTPERIAVADQESARRFGHLRPGPKRVGLVRAMPEVSTSIDSNAPRHFPFGGDQSMWTLAIRSPGAFAVRVHFTDFDAPEASVVLYAYGREGLITRGPYTGKGSDRNGDFWTPSLPGEEIYIEMTGMEMPKFGISEIVHFDDYPGASDTDRAATDRSVLGCHLDVMCYDVSTSARQATGQMNFVSGGGSYVCTGTLLSDHDDETWAPYFLTAEHCIGSQAEASSLEVVWFYQRDSCGGPLPDYATLPRSTGGTLLESVSADDGNDMAFIRLAGDLPGGIAFAGWTTETSIDGVGIHHPAGSWKRTVFLSPVGVCPGCLCADGSDFDYYNMVDGLNQGGSSGSGIFNSSGRLAGQLLGRCSSDGTHPDDLDCGNIDSFWAMYGEFEETHPVISWWLAVGGTLHVDHASQAPGIGTPAWPFTWIYLALDGAWPGARIKIAGGTYGETFTINQDVTLVSHGGMVTIGEWAP